MSLQLPDDANFKAMDKAYYRGLREKHKTKVAIAKASGESRSTVDRKFKGWGWNKEWVEPDESVADPPPAAASSSSPTHSTTTPSTNGQPTRDFLEPAI